MRFPPMLTVDQRHKYRLCSRRRRRHRGLLERDFLLVLKMSSLTVYTPRWPADFSFTWINVINIAFAVAAPSWLPGARISPSVQNEFINCLHSSLARGLFFHVPPSPLEPLKPLPHLHPPEYDIRKEAGDASPIPSQRTVLGPHVTIIKSGCISVSQIRLRIHKLIVIILKHHPCDLPPMLTVDQRHKYRICSRWRRHHHGFLERDFPLVFKMSSLTVYTPRWLADFLSRTIITISLHLPTPPEYDIRKEAGDASPLPSQRTVFGYEAC
ncbi:hypothetical protein CDAR_602211 [Caerostris darwini]|uniref:Uncharacterized protein n=1 Tax=Caerostris darwini TaxID=1538125 RepID=A0AAV4NAH2_9ARAC|nr:hypothetical protein CDAR_602211 [Caerostris darwini]